MMAEKAMRAAMLKSRFADTILKATLVIQGGKKSDVSSLQQERRVTEKAGRVEASPSPLPRKKQHHSKISSERERKAARMSLEMMEKTVDVDKIASMALEKARRRERERKAARMALQKMETSVNLDKSAASILKDLEILFGRPVGTGYPNAKTLERLSLYMKKDNYLEEDEDAVMDLEEGEIMS